MSFGAMIGSKNPSVVTAALPKAKASPPNS
jgi:hypothetical protein